MGARQLVASQVVRRVFRVAILLVAARLLGVTGFGVYALLLTLVEMVAVVSGFGYADYLTREVAKRPGAAWPLFTRVTQVRLLYIVPSVLAALLVLKVLGFSPAMGRSLTLFSLTLLPRAFNESAQGVLKGLRRFGLLPWIEFVQGATGLVGAPLLLMRGLGLNGMLAAEVAAAGAGCVVAVAGAARVVDFHRTEDLPLTAVLRATFAFNVYPVLANVYDRVDVVLLAKLAGSIATGIYSLPYRAYATLSILPSGVMGSLLPVFSASRADQEARQKCAQAMKFLYATALLAVLGTWAFARPAILLVLGESYLASATVLRILVWASIPMFLNGALNTLLLAAHKEKVFLGTASACLVFNVAANLIVIPRFSYHGAAGVTVATEVLLLAQNLYWVRRFFGELVLPAGVIGITAAFAATLGSLFVLQRVLPETWAEATAFGGFAVVLAATWKGAAFHAFKVAMRPRMMEPQTRFRE
ncbi:MAG TPA: polysaccharide biosynthesis C-terminal domain-containing protein [Terriglobales bacterium]|nr:polysaccharide biosynthesis C-terminal domain-containing protein [Terriglobales bacterium]